MSILRQIEQAKSVEELITVRQEGRADTLRSRIQKKRERIMELKSDVRDLREELEGLAGEDELREAVLIRLGELNEHQLEA
tara:strand:- start:29187 stop:29429 length:243 start_codon:yes stop_codon:yes gene_type:complete